MILSIDIGIVKSGIVILDNNKIVYAVNKCFKCGTSRRLMHCQSAITTFFDELIKKFDIHKILIEKQPLFNRANPSMQWFLMGFFRAHGLEPILLHPGNRFNGLQIEDLSEKVAHLKSAYRQRKWC